MKKTILFVFALMQFSFMFGSTNKILSVNACISGPTTIYIGQTVTFTSINKAQCNQCYDWDINGEISSSDNSIVGTLQIVGSDMNESVSIKGVSAGTGTICVRYLDETTGCEPCCINVNVIPVPGSNCNSSELEGMFECRGGGSSGSLLSFVDNSSNPVDWTKISSINIWLNGAVQTGTNLSTLTLIGPYTNATHPFGISITAQGVCSYGSSFGAIVTFNYNNGCPSVQKGGNWYNYNTPLTKVQEIKINRIQLFPNPSKSIIQFKGQDVNDSFISVYDLSGSIIVSKSRVSQNLNISKLNKGTYIYKIEKNSQLIQEGKIIKE